MQKEVDMSNALIQGSPEMQFLNKIEGTLIIKLLQYILDEEKCFCEAYLLAPQGTAMYVEIGFYADIS